MTAGSIVALFAAMAVLALTPSVSVLTVTARAAAAGFLHGALTALGIVAADILFILLAVFGLALLTEAMGPWADLIGYAGGVYLVLLGAMAWRGRKAAATAREARPASLFSSFMAGLMLTLGDQKAVLFYLGFLPAFLDLSAITGPDIAVLVAVTVIAVGGVKLGYAWAADRAGSIIGPKAGEIMGMIAAAVMVAVGMFLIGKTALGA